MICTDVDIKIKLFYKHLIHLIIIKNNNLLNYQTIVNFCLEVDTIKYEFLNYYIIHMVIGTIIIEI